MSLLLSSIVDLLLISLLTGYTLLFELLLSLAYLIVVVVMRLSIVRQLGALLLARAAELYLLLLLLAERGVGIGRLDSWKGERMVQLLLRLTAGYQLMVNRNVTIGRVVRRMAGSNTVGRHD